MQNSHIALGFNDALFNSLQMIFSTVCSTNRNYVLMFVKVSWKSSFVYNHDKDCIHGFKDCLGRTQFMQKLRSFSWYEVFVLIGSNN